MDKYDDAIEGIRKVLQKHKLQLFKIEIGDLEQFASFKRNESYSKWCKRQEQEFKSKKTKKKSKGF